MIRELTIKRIELAIYLFKHNGVCGIKVRFCDKCLFGTCNKCLTIDAYEKAKKYLKRKKDTFFLLDL
jgi:hypothetical protein